MNSIQHTRAKHRRAQQYYDEVADDYDSEFRKQDDHIDRREKEILREELGDLSGTRALDFGCGTGRISLFHRQRGATSVLGVDVSPRMIAIAQSKCDDPAVEFQVFDPQQTDRSLGGREPFDVVSSLEVLEYFEDPEEFLSILSSNVSDNGCVVFDFINCQNLSAWLKSWLSSQWRASGIGLYRVGQVRKLCAKQGLEVINTNGVYMSLLPISIHSRIPIVGSRWPTLERFLNRSRLMRRFLSYRVLVTARKRP